MLKDAGMNALGQLISHLSSSLVALAVALSACGGGSGGVASSGPASSGDGTASGSADASSGPADASGRDTTEASKPSGEGSAGDESPVVEAEGGSTGLDAATTAVPCPPTPPATGSECGVGQDCYYEDCGRAGRTIALCVPNIPGAVHGKGTLDVRSAACTPVSCEGSQSSNGPIICAAGQICLMTASGISWGQCVANTCGAGPLSGACLSPSRSQCTVIGTAAGIDVECVQCASPPCG